MSRLNILFLTKDRTHQMEKSSHYFGEELKKQCNLTIWTEDGHIANILRQIPFTPDFIFINDVIDPRLAPTIQGLKNIKIPTGVLFHDISYEIQKRKQYVISHNIDYVFTHYREAFLKWFPEFRNRMVWVPHSVNVDVHKDYMQKKTIDMLMMGATVRTVYPLRDYMLKKLTHQPGFIYHPHPGYCEVDKVEKGSLVGKDYAMEINRAKIFFTCNSVFKYPLMKYFEVLACNTLLLAPLSKDLQELGFRDGVNCVDVGYTNFLQKANYYLQNEQERKKIAQNGYQMVRMMHTTKHRVEQFLIIIRRLVEERNR
ncbi:glycosyltransferase [Pseudalkalibacillus decolorationis]|uniref:glycosyltransferase family protein n=1 Tax=Pseudalkalibacillus decolorationis TaxID=163879 RepID=UPI0021473A3F|nr:glycosyltransferase [Pseudalkalibacillus decolorationis]